MKYSMPLFVVVAAASFANTSPVRAAVPCETRITDIVVAHQHKWEYFPDPLPCCPMVAVLSANTDVFCFHSLRVTEEGICAGYEDVYYDSHDPNSGNATDNLCLFAPDPLELSVSSSCFLPGGDCLVVGPDMLTYGNAAAVMYSVARQHGQKITTTSRVVYSEDRGRRGFTGFGRYICEGYPYAVGNGVIPFDFSCYTNPSGGVRHKHTIGLVVGLSPYDDWFTGPAFGTTRLVSMHHYWNPTTCNVPEVGDPVHGGVVAILEDGTVIQLGFATGFTVTPGTNSISIAGTYENTVTCSGSTGSASADNVDTAANWGDATRDNIINYQDRQAWVTRFGLGINEFGYTPRLDYDLDGDLDISDLTAFNTAHCSADVDDGTGTGTWDGGVTNDDLLYFIDVFELGSPQADLDDGSGTGLPDGGVTLDDLLFYSYRFELGC